MARWNAGEFHFTQDATPAARTIEISNTNLMMEAARQIDEWKLLAKKIGSTRMMPVFAPSVASSVSLSALEWSVVSRVDEHRNLEEIAAALGQSTFDVCKIVYGLLASGTIALREDLRRLPIERVRRLPPQTEKQPSLSTRSLIGLKGFRSTEGMPYDFFRDGKNIFQGARI